MSLGVAAGSLGAWMLLAGGLAYSGVLSRWEPPRPALGLFAFALFGHLLLFRRLRSGAAT